MKKYFLDLFSGIGGFALGAAWAGLQFDGHYYSEVDKYASAVYQKRFTEAASLGDCRKIDYAKLPIGDWFVSGGFPCQPHSLAGKRKAAEDERDLWGECSRVLGDLRPEIALFENVPGLLTSEKGEFFKRVLCDIAKHGYDAEWGVVSARDVGAWHLRKRIWIVCYKPADLWDAVRLNEKAEQ